MRVVVKPTRLSTVRVVRAFTQTTLLLGVAFCGLWAAGMLEGTIFQTYGERELVQASARHRTSHAVSAAYAGRVMDDFTRTHPTVGDVIGQIEIPRLDLSVVVFEGATEAQLRKGAGRIPLTGLPGEDENIAIAAHRNTFFRPLEKIQEGDRISLKTPYGEYHYQVAFTWVISPDRVEVLNPKIGDALTLVTCFPFEYVGNAPNRFIVRATPVPVEGEERCVK